MICLFVLTQLTNVTDRQTHTHTQTPHDDIGRAYASQHAAKIKNEKMCVTKYMIQRTIVGLSYTVCLETNARVPVIIVKLPQRTATGVLYKQYSIRSVSAE